ncbi:unnamed protein product [Macrosiphum euphorbiae]|uniref:YqaJ viral recombinase domain-containing protein n=1 Tax=Macrosiphum euphorbiae TaxID=13131 RepID=A0AAV0WQN2_9HEMI|nr:unnamed protein product [Macrosiphum euphorbiae]
MTQTEMRDSVILHVMPFPREESHYTRNKNNKEFLSPDLNISRLHKAYKIQNPDSNVSLQFYRRTFLKYFPTLSFRRPRTDTCMTCDRLHMIGKDIRIVGLNAIKEKELHLRKADKAKTMMYYNMKDAQEPNSDMLVLCMDLEKVLFVPRLTHCQMYYSRQLSVYNLYLHVGDTRKSYMCVRHEGVVSRGANEICSSFLKVVTSRITTKKNIQMWCDNCAGQNKNKMLVFVMFYLVATGWFESIECLFLVSGHSFMPCDQDFAMIEKRKKRVSSMVPSELKEMIEASKLNNPFEVVDIEDGDIVDLNLTANRFLNTTKMAANRDEIERETVEQSQSRKWLEPRRYLLTASNFGQVISSRPDTGCEGILKSMLYSPDLDTRAMEYGREHEQDAKKDLELALGIEIKECGLYIDSNNVFLGATPDGLIGHDTLVEVKCPFSAADMDPEEAILNKKITFWKINKKKKK